MSQLMRRASAMKADAAGEPAPALRRARLATGTLFFANGCGLGSWVPHIPEVKIRHDFSEGGLGLALLVIAAFSLAMAIGRFSGDRLVARHGAMAVLAGGALTGAASLGIALIAGHPLAAVAGFAGMGIGLSNIIPVVFSAAGRLPGLAPGIGIAAVSTTGYFGYLAGPPLIGLVAEASSLPIGLGLVALLASLIVAGAMTLQRPQAPVAALGG